MSSHSVNKIGVGAVAVLYAVGIEIIPGVDALNQGAPPVQWLPDITYAVLFLVLMVGIIFEKPNITIEGFDLTALVGFGGSLIAGLVYAFIGYSDLTVMIMIGFGGLGIGAILLAKYWNPSTRKTEA